MVKHVSELHADMLAPWFFVIVLKLAMRRAIDEREEGLDIQVIRRQVKQAQNVKGHKNATVSWHAPNSV